MNFDTSKLLTNILDEIDISDTLYEKAVKKYTAVSDWLEDKNCILSRYNVDIYPQGSFRLGTVVKPVSDNDDYDIDLVCCLNNIDNLSPQEIKKIVGQRLKENEVYNRMLQEEGKRCWTLEYSEKENFHLDILPSISDNIQDNSQYSSHAIKITDKTKPGVWINSNPKGFAQWFEDRQRKILDEHIKNYAFSIKASVEAVPSIQKYNLKTPLRQAVKLLKRHRDIMFDNIEGKPASIILTTLAAKAYNNEVNLLHALQGIVSRIEQYILIGVDHSIRIENPIRPSENFADRCNTPELKNNLISWIKKLKEDFNLEAEINFSSKEKDFSKIFGSVTINKVAKKIASISYPSIHINTKTEKPWSDDYIK